MCGHELDRDWPIDLTSEEIRQYTMYAAVNKYEATRCRKINIGHLSWPELSNQIAQGKQVSY